MDESPKSPRRREHVRAPIELRVEYKKMNTFFSDYTKNISKGGTFIKTERPLKPGTEFVFKLFVPAKYAPFEIRGVVTWVNTVSKKDRPSVEESGMGIRFNYDDATERDEFEGIVESLIQDALGERVYQKLMAEGRSKTF